jgi:hypothetical protein
MNSDEFQFMNNLHSLIHKCTKFLFLWLKWKKVCLYQAEINIFEIQSWGKVRMSGLKSRITKTTSALLVILIIAGTATGAFIWLSNRISSPIEVSGAPIELTGTFNATPFIGQETLNTFDYVCLDPTRGQGFILIEFYAVSGSDTLSVGDIEVVMSMNLGGTLVSVGGLVAGYPQNNGTDGLQFLFGMFNSAIIDFSQDSGSGFFSVYITYHVSFLLEAHIQITSTSS